MTRILALLALGLILSNSLCMALCAATDCRPLVRDSGACHHSEKPDPAVPCSHNVMWRADAADPSPPDPSSMEEVVQTVEPGEHSLTAAVAATGPSGPTLAGQRAVTVLRI